MAKVLLMQFLTLSIYTAFMGFCFCDGFKLPVAKKLIWFVVFFALASYVLKTYGQFDLTLILPIPTLLAMLICVHEIKKTKKGES